MTLAILFGSRTDGTAVPRSDIDIAVRFEPELDSEAEPTARATARYTLIGRLSSAFGRDDIDMVDLEYVDPRIAHAALTNGEILIGSEAEAAALARERQQEREEIEAKKRSERAAVLDRIAARIEEHRR